MKKLLKFALFLLAGFYLVKKSKAFRKGFICALENLFEKTKFAAVEFFKLLREE